MAFVKTYEDLDVFQDAFSLSLDIHRKSLEFPKIEQYVLADQLRRSSKSVCANIAEGFAKQQASKAEFRRFLFMALGSSEETSVWIKYARELAYISQSCANDWGDQCNKISRMIQSLASRIKTQQSGNENSKISDNRSIG